MVTTSRHERTEGAFGHLLLVVVLALGVFLMHTLGHSDCCSPASATSSSSHTSPMALDTAPQAGADLHAEASAFIEWVSWDKPGQATTPHTPLMPMDVLSLCVAVLLSAWVLTALVRSALARRAYWTAASLLRGPVVVRPNPPPRTPDLTQLSVLRL
ncbi:hypothetical protein GCM10011579_075350 [Streptomyces albiflavescens]|uniref:Uncharacterized protein n=1 Tax=Streptomyces albiflavescens TaxID=1623582 RepID=A0A917YB10_9ACTN|nr:DUF6153 family protein [Streptomyces albiflavescens]GGN84886.1 hypothetical protein GCM10011579_075350 [Streptomyces albiflavescens]